MTESPADDVEPTGEQWEKFGQALEEAAVLLTAIGLRKQILFDIIEETDWGFALKLHAVVDSVLEAAIEKAISKTPGSNQSVASKLPSGLSFAGRSGKVDWARAFGLVGEDTADWLKAINQLRNAFAHSIRNVDRTMEEIAAANGGDAFLQRLVRVPMKASSLRPTSPAQWRLFVVTAAMFALWEIQFSRVYRGPGAYTFLTGKAPE